METFKLKLHSSVDLITNSSTVIFTYSEGSIPKLKELINEILKMSNENLFFDDVFNAEVFCDDYIYLDHVESPLNNSSELQELKENILKGVQKKPDWMIEIEEEGNWSGYNESTYLEIYPKDKKYEGLSKKVIDFLYSTNHEATSEG
jgi:hypothetical protein